MIGDIKKLAFGNSYIIIYQGENTQTLLIPGKDIDKFMDDIKEKWSKILTKKLNKLCKSVIEENKNEVS